MKKNLILLLSILFVYLSAVESEAVFKSDECRGATSVLSKKGDPYSVFP